MGRKPLNTCLAAPDTCLTPPDMGLLPPNTGRFPPDTGRNCPGTGRMASDRGRISPDRGRKLSGRVIIWSALTLAAPWIFRAFASSRELFTAEAQRAQRLRREIKLSLCAPSATRSAPLR